MLTFPTEPVNDVLILGAGFSRSLSTEMPLTDDLGNAVRTDVAERSDLAIPPHFESGQFEAWLSRIAEDQPDLTRSENLSNRVLFQLCSESLASVLNDRVRAAKAEALAQVWLFDLLGSLHVRQVTVITFNQDTLVEFALDRADLCSWDQSFWPVYGEQPPVRWADCLNGQPPFPSTRYGYGPPVPTFSLKKLHGSTNWFWRPGDESGATTACWFLEGTLPPEVARPNEAAALRRELPGRVPLIVPPAAGKTTYYRTPMLIQLWQDARIALSQPDVRTSLVGYSIPPTDLVTSGMLRETLGGRSDLESALVDVVNPDPGPVSRNLNALGVDPSKIDVAESVKEFAEQYLRRAAEDVVNAFRTSSSSETNCLLLVGSSIVGGRKVIEIRPQSIGDLELVLEEGQPPYISTNRSAEGAPAPLQLRDLLDRLKVAGVSRLVATNQAGERRPIVGAVEYGTNVGAGNGRWQVLVTARSI